MYIFLFLSLETEDIQKDDTAVLDELGALLNNAKPSDDLDLLLGDAESILKDVDSLLGCEEGSTNCHQQVITALVKEKDSLTVEYPPGKKLIHYVSVANCSNHKIL